MPRPRNSLHWLGDQLGQMGSFRVSEENAATGLQQAEQRDQHRGSCPPPWAPQSRTCIHWCAWGLSAGNLGFSGQTWGKDWALLHRDSLKALECALSCNQKQSRTDPGSAIGATLLMGAKRGGALHSSLVLSMSLAGTAPPLWVLGACKHQRIVPTPRWG